MSKGDCAAVDIDLGRIEAELLDAHQRLAGERLVELHEVEIVGLDPGALEGLARGRYRADAHDRRIDPRHRGRNDPGQGLEAELVGPSGLDQEHRRRPVVYARSVSGCDGPAVAECRAEPGQRLGGRVGPGMLVARHDDGLALPLGDLDRHDLGVEPARLDGRDRLSLRVEGERVLALTRDVPTFGHVLGRLAHRVRVMRRSQPRIDEPPAQGAVVELARAAVPGGLWLGHDVRRPGHRLDTAADEHVAVVDLNGMRGRVDRLEPAPAQPVDGQPGDLDREAGQQQGHSGDVAVVFAGLVGAAEDDVFDQGRVDPGPIDHRAQHGRGEVVRSNRVKSPAVPTDRRSGGRDDPRIPEAAIEDPGQ